MRIKLSPNEMRALLGAFHYRGPSLDEPDSPYKRDMQELEEAISENCRQFNFDLIQARAVGFTDEGCPYRLFELLHALYYDSRAFDRRGSPVPDGARLGIDPGDEAYLPVYPGPTTIMDLACKFGKLSEAYVLDNDPQTFGHRIRSNI